MHTPTLLNRNIAHTSQSSRLHFLDGLRGIAILLVVLYHTYSNAWVELVPFFSPSFDIPFIKYGDLGVPLFFIISGFVIVMTLERCKSFNDFMFKRWLRLFPAMLIATLLIMLTAPIFTVRPLGTPYAIDAIPGLTFIAPSFFQGLFNHSQTMLEGGFWSLFVEVKFYIVAGWLYFGIGQKKMITALVIMFLSFTGFNLVQSYLVAHAYLSADTVLTLKAMLDCLDYEYYGWFAAGALFYRYFMTKNKLAFAGAVFIALISARSWGGFMSGTMVAFLVIISIFAGAMISTRLQKFLSNKILTFTGFISYPLYLIHENATISTIVQLHEMFNSINVYALSLIPLAASVFMAWLIAEYLEPQLKAWIKIMRRKFTSKESPTHEPISA